MYNTHSHRQWLSALSLWQQNSTMGNLSHLPGVKWILFTLSLFWDAPTASTRSWTEEKVALSVAIPGAYERRLLTGALQFGSAGFYLMSTNICITTWSWLPQLKFPEDDLSQGEFGESQGQSKLGHRENGHWSDRFVDHNCSLQKQKCGGCPFTKAAMEEETAREVGKESDKGVWKGAQRHCRETERGIIWCQASLESCTFWQLRWAELIIDEDEYVLVWSVWVLWFRSRRNKLKKGEKENWRISRRVKLYKRYAAVLVLDLSFPFILSSLLPSEPSVTDYKSSQAKAIE